MKVLSIIQNGIAQAVRALGAALAPVRVAGAVAFQPQPGEDYEPSWDLHLGKGFFEKTEETDYPGTTVAMTDSTLVLLGCSYDVKVHDFVQINADITYHVYAVAPIMVGSTRVLQKLLVRPERKVGIPWDSVDLTVA